MPMVQWPFQELKLEVPNIYKAYVSGLNFRGCTPNFYGQQYGTFTYLHVLDPGIPMVGVRPNLRQAHSSAVPVA